MTKEKWVEIWDDKENFKLTDIYGLNFLDYELIESSVKTNEVDMPGIDGVMVGTNTLEPFDIVLNFFFDGADKHDLNLFAEKLRNKLRRRDPFYLRHSYLPGIKYAINSAEINHEKLNHSDAEITMTFHCYKGYSESFKETNEYSLYSDNWQFENNLLSDSNIKYKHNTTSFSIYNGSTDTINPLLRHKFKLLINIDAPNGFKLENKTTGDVFEYKKPIKKNTQIMIQGVHPFIGNNRVGIDTNWKWITLDAGYNEIEITGKNIGETSTQWIFPFIYR